MVGVIMKTQIILGNAMADDLFVMCDSSTVLKLFEFVICVKQGK